MITLIRKSDDTKADEIESRFQELILAYKTEICENGPNEEQLPTIRDGESVISGEEEIDEWLRELEEDLTWQRSLSGDGCYIDPKSGDVC